MMIRMMGMVEKLVRRVVRRIMRRVMSFWTKKSLEHWVEWYHTNPPPAPLLSPYPKTYKILLTPTV